jgi:hypothetical protein
MLVAGSVPASAGQQKWASQYVNWKSDGQVSEVTNIDQQIWIVHPSDGGYWPMQWGYTGLTYGGYMGLQQSGINGQQVRFSIWNAIAAEGEDCKPFGGEGVGQTCTLSVKIETNRLYRLRLWRLDATSDGQWWGGWLITTARNGAPVEHYIGRIKARAEAKTIKPNSIRNFAEYFGSSFSTCNKVPLSIVGLSPPALNSKGKGTGAYQGYTTYSGSKRAAGNLCATGKENVGAAITVTPYDFGFANGVMMFLGATPSQHTLDPKKNPMPPAVPNN